MKPSDDELILYYYGEHEAAQDLESALASDPELARRYDTLRHELSALDRLPAAEPRPGLEGRMWARIAPELTRPARGVWLRRVLLGTAAAAVVLVAFVSGRFTRTPPTETTVRAEIKGLSPDARARVLEAALADHLESSQRLLLEVANGHAPLQEEREAASALLAENALYRRSAERAGKPRVAAVLTELDALLQDIARDSEASSSPTPQLRADSKDLLFKVSVARNDLKRYS